MSPLNPNFNKKLKESNQQNHKVGIDDLPIEISLDILQDILQRLPTTSLVRFKGVCKAWLRLASHPDLSNLHENPCLVFHSLKSPRQLKLIEGCYFRDKDDMVSRPIEQLTLPFITEEWTVDSILSCNGLLLVNYVNKCYNRKVSVYNPVIEKFVTLPEPKLLPSVDIIWSVYGFGFDPVMKQYKVVRNFCSRPDNHFYVFTLGTSDWRHVNSTGYKLTRQKKGVWCKGALHWMSDVAKIVSFDLLDEKFCSISLPSGDPSPSAECLVVLGDSLSIVLYYSSQIVIWSMTEYGVEDSWTKKFTLHNEWVYDIVPVCLLKDGNILVKNAMNNFWFCDPRTGSHVRFHWRGLWNCSSVTTFEHSLVWPFT